MILRVSRISIKKDAGWQNCATCSLPLSSWIFFSRETLRKININTNYTLAELTLTCSTRWTWLIHVTTQSRGFLLRLAAFAMRAHFMNIFLQMSGLMTWNDNLLFSTHMTMEFWLLKNTFGNDECDERPNPSGEAPHSAKNVRSGHTSTMTAARDRAVYHNGQKIRKTSTRSTLNLMLYLQRGHEKRDKWC